MAETELSVLSGQCLDRRIPDRQTLIEEVAAWQEDRNKVDWQFIEAASGRKTALAFVVDPRCAILEQSRWAPSGQEAASHRERMNAMDTFQGCATLAGLMSLRASHWAVPAVSHVALRP
jgi:hypothetical protein